MKVSVAAALTCALLVAVVAWWWAQAVDVPAPPVALVASGSSSAGAVEWSAESVLPDPGNEGRSATIRTPVATDPDRGGSGGDSRGGSLARRSARILVQDQDGIAIDLARIFVKVPAHEAADGDFASVLDGRDGMKLARAGVAVLSIDPTRPLALAVRHPDFLPAVRSFGVGEVPAEVVVMLAPAGKVRGVVHGGVAGQHRRSVQIWRSSEEPHGDSAAAVAVATKPKRRSMRQANVDAEGRFLVTSLEPGVWRAGLARGNAASPDEPFDPKVGAVPLLDSGLDPRAVVEFVAVAGQETTIELHEAPLGTLRGKVLLRGVPCADALVFGVRPGRLASSRSVTRTATDASDWDREWTRESAAGQQTAADGGFVFHYREAGPVELWVRHRRGAATSPPTVLVLPDPGFGMECTLALDGAAIRGRFAIEQLPVEARPHVRAVLYPMSKAGVDPIDALVSAASGCEGVELTDGGRFAFEYVPPGDWLVRIEAFHSGAEFVPSWQQVVPVQFDVVELGDLRPWLPVAATLHWQWLDGDPNARDVWYARLHAAHAADERAVWVGTFQERAGAIELRAPPGCYSVAVFGRDGPDDRYLSRKGAHGLPGRQLSQPIAIEVHADGRVTPAVLPLVAQPPR